MLSPSVVLLPIVYWPQLALVLMPRNVKQLEVLWQPLLNLSLASFYLEVELCVLVGMMGSWTVLAIVAVIRFWSLPVLGLMFVLELMLSLVWRLPYRTQV
ncbi:unnamed protein product [Prorocentrum cordatum]|uniref:Uncharacterized protein n=1 Tax=Prorocentrum cordatum TaxID=2364126 RepID=A0ABN9XVE8_9DINO|nr:unnamed protein product [Polarella glacialis]